MIRKTDGETCRQKGGKIPAKGQTKTGQIGKKWLRCSANGAIVNIFKMSAQGGHCKSRRKERTVMEYRAVRQAMAMPQMMMGRSACIR